MTVLEHNFAPGNLVHARGREWVVQNESTESWLKLRPLGGTDDDIISLIPELELEPVKSATFQWPDANKPGNHSAALLLRDALRLNLRTGAGPFRSFGNIAVEPRAYQLVPLLMALRLNTVRLLIADDVGIGKTIEAGLIVRELMDRGEISKLAVLCPPHLVEQWQSELENRFNLSSVALTSATASRVEREVPYGVSLMNHYPIVVVSLDYIKSERHREHFISMAPEFVIVDEAHTCASSGPGKQLRFDLLQRLAADEERHLLMLTATPHSGNEEAFYNLISLLKPKFLELRNRTSANDPLRQELARHFVQRRRQDIIEWQVETDDSAGFPRRMKAEVTYKLTGEWGAFFDAVQNYCVELAESIEQQGENQARLVWYATLALLRCVASSPAAAVRALSNRLENIENTENLLTDERLHDGDMDDLTASDIEPPAQIVENQALNSLIHTAEKLSGKQGDPKLAILIKHLEEHIKDGFHPVVFCRYVATAHYVAEHLKKAFPKVTIEAVTGEQPPEERRLRVEDMFEAEQRLLVATDCLSEGINLQHLFTSVVHYDLAWNPTRHEQREGRVDRFGQQAPEVRCTMLYGEDNPVDGFIINVILRKAEAIQKELGVLVPMPEDDTRINQALVKAALMKRSSSPYTQDLFADMQDELQQVETKWQDALENAKKNRTVFAQRRIQPHEVLPEWQKQQEALGTQADVERFIKTATARLNAPLEKARGNKHRFLPQHLPESLRLRLADEGIDKPQLIDFNELHRSNPLVSLLANHLLEESLQEEHPLAARCAATETDAVDVVTTIYLLRMRHNLEYIRRREPFQLMAEETVAVAVKGRVNPEWILGPEANKLLECVPTGNLPKELIVREVGQALEFLASHQTKLEELAQERATALLEDHKRVREAARDVGQYSVTPCLPVDVIGVYVLLPDAL